MATLNTLRGEIQTSLHGRRIGIDANELIISKGNRHGITAATSDTTGTALPNTGYVTIDSTTGDSYVLTDPVPGCSVTIACISTGGIQTITPANATIQSSASSTGPDVQLTGRGSITLMGASTALYVPTSRYGTSAVAHVSTA
jgi:hypothetical protein